MSKEIALKSLEDWINEVVAKKADGQNSLIPVIIREGFKREMQANVTYHDEIAKCFTDENDHALAKYHALMAEIYANLM